MRQNVPCSELCSEFFGSQVVDVIDLHLLCDWAAFALHDVLAVGVRELNGNLSAGVWDVRDEDHLVDLAAIISGELKVVNSVPGLVGGEVSLEVSKSGIAFALGLKVDGGRVIADLGNEETGLSSVDLRECGGNLCVNLSTC